MTTPIIPVDTSRLTLKAGGSTQPVQEWGEKDGRRQPVGQQRDEHGTPLWDVTVLAVLDGTAHEWVVRVPAAQEPALPVLSDVRARALAASVSWKGSVTFTASSIEPVKAAQ